MEKKRHISKLQSVFDLSHCGTPQLTDSTLGRVMFIYDEKENLREFTLLNRGIPKEIKSRIVSWLEENIDVCNDVWGSDSNESDIVV